MPTYEYHCEKCKKDFDLYQSMKDDPVATCPKEQCRQKTWGKGKVRRLLGTGAGLIFKGSGFYITDYRSEGYKEAAKNDATSSKPAESKPAESKAADSKPDAASKPAPAKPAPAAEARKPKKKE
jgi:putative FmdB family regulatory protein